MSDVQGSFDALQPDKLQRLALERAAHGPIFGPYIEDMAARATTDVLNGEYEREDAVAALGTAALLYAHSEANYKHYGHSGTPIGGEALDHHHENVGNGRIELVAEPHRTTAEFGRSQVLAADALLSRMSSTVEAVLARLNYTLYFNNNTMADVKRTLANESRIVEQTDFEAMPHLQLSNWAIGQVVASLYEGMSRLNNGASLHLLDICSGTGATISTSLASIHHLREEGKLWTPPPIGITTIETTPDFQKQLVKTVGELASQSGFVEAAEVQPADFNGIQDGVLQMVEADAVSMIRDGKVFEQTAPSDVFVLTINYGAHRLDSTKKQEILGALANQPNVVIIIGDLISNGSPVNTGYFNIAVNGAANPGNIGLEEDLQKFGFEQVSLGRQYPARLDPRIRPRLNDRTKDMRFLIAYKGFNAEEALNLQTVAR